LHAGSGQARRFKEMESLEKEIDGKGKAFAFPSPMK
jgi:hypothetical protein